MIFSFGAKNSKRGIQLKLILVVIMRELCVKVTGSVLC